MTVRREPAVLEDMRAMFPVGSRALWVGIDGSARVVVLVRAHFARATRVRFPDGAIHLIHPGDLRPRSWSAD